MILPKAEFNLFTQVWMTAKKNNNIISLKSAFPNDTCQNRSVLSPPRINKLGKLHVLPIRLMKLPQIQSLPLTIFCPPSSSLHSSPLLTNEMDFQLCEPSQTPLIFSLNCLQRRLLWNSVHCTFNGCEFWNSATWISVLLSYQSSG